MKVIHRKDLNVEDIRSEEYWNRLRIYSILNNEESDNKLLLTSLVERALKTRDTVLTVCKSLKSERNYKNNSISSYNLSSMTYIVENLPLLTFLRITNEFSNVTTKYRDLKYIDRDSTYFVRIPKEISQDMHIRKLYEKIQFKSIGNYRELYLGDMKNGKNFAHYLLPLGVQNRAVLSMSIKENIELSNALLCSDLVVENQLGDMFETLLAPYIEIIPNSERRTVVKEILKYLLELLSDQQKFKEEMIGEFGFEYIDDIVEHLISNFEEVINPLGSKYELEFDYKDQRYIGKLISKSKLGAFTRSKGSFLSGYLSLSEILKLLSYSYSMYIPLLTDFIDIDKELTRPNSRCFMLPKQIDSKKEIGKELSKRLIDIYNDIKKWRTESKRYMSEEISREYTLYLLPLAHMTKFNLYLDIDDIFSIKEKELEYKKEWLKLFYQKDPLFKS